MKQIKIEYSTNIMDLNLDIGMTIQKIQAGEIHDDDFIEHLEAIQTSLTKISNKMLGG